MATTSFLAASSPLSTSSSSSFSSSSSYRASSARRRQRSSHPNPSPGRQSGSPAPALRLGGRYGLVAAAAAAGESGSGDSGAAAGPDGQKTKTQIKPIPFSSSSSSSSSSTSSSNSTLSPVSLESIAADPSAGSVAVPSTLSSVSSDFAASSIVRRYYDAFNARDVDAAVECFDKNVVYEDLVFGKAFRSAEDVRDYLVDVKNIVPDGLQFVLDDITDGGGKVGAIWHVEINGKPFFFSRGCSFYRVDVHSQKITYARDIPEPVSKPGRVALVMLRLISDLTKRFPKLLDFVDKDSVLPPFKN